MKRDLISFTFFIMIFISIMIFTSLILKRKPTKEAGVNNSEIEGFYHEPDNSIDVLYLGSSHMFSSISPLELYKEYGFTGFIRSSSCQKIWATETLLKDSLRTQSPKVLVLEVMMAYDMSDQSEAFNREVYDYIWPSLVTYYDIFTKLPADESIVSYIFPVLRYHDRWIEMTKEDIDYYFMDRHMYCKGFLPRTGRQPLEKYPDNMYNDDQEAVEYDEEAEAYFYRIKKICDDMNIKLVLYKSPTMYEPFWNMGKHKGTSMLAEKLGVPFIDQNIGDMKVAINWKTETLDGGNHVNYYGAMKCTKRFGEWLHDNYLLPDHRGDDIGVIWDNDYNKFYSEIEPC